jgi:hypothetical protein
MITKLYWATRLSGYIACLGGIFLFLAHQPDAESTLRNTGLGIVGIGFLAFFLSYALRAWLRFGPGRKTDGAPAP